MPVTLAELARRLELELRGDGRREIRSVATLEGAGPSDLAFVASRQYRSLLATTRAGAVILRAEDVDDYRGNVLIGAAPHLAFARAATLLHPPMRVAPGCHPSTVVAPGATVASSAAIGAHCVIDSGATIADQVSIGPGCLIGSGVTIGPGSRLIARVTIYAGSTLGRDCLVHAGAVIGSDGFGFARDGVRWEKVPQLGRVVIGDEVEIGANTTIDRGALGDTVIGNGVKLDNLIQIAHNVRIGEHTAIAACTGIAGSAVIGRRCQIGGQVGIIGHLEIVDDVVITAQSLVSHSIRAAGVYSSSVSADEARRWRRNAARLGQLDELVRRVRALEHKQEGSNEEQ